ncbi:DMT family transporter [candidate division KSB1 bacterium]
MTDQNKAYIYAGLAVLFWSTVASAFKISLRYVDYLQLLFFSSFVSLTVLFIVLAAKRKLPLLRRQSASDLARSALLGFLNPFLYYIVLFKAYSILPAQEAQPLNYTWPIMIVLLSIPILGQRIKPLGVIAVFISFCGVLVISTHGDVLGFRFTNPGGAALALGSSTIWATFWIYNLRDKRDAVLKLFLNFAFGFIYLLVAVPLVSDVAVPEVGGIIGVAYVGLFEMGITFVVWMTALKLSVTTAKVSNLIYLSPFISLFFIRTIVGEVILPSTIVGLILIVGGILLQRRG